MNKLKRISLTISSIIMTVLPAKVFAASFETMFTDENGKTISCSNYYCWIAEVWKWALTIMIPLSAVVLMAAGVLYTTSAGDTKKIDTAKKLVYGVASGIALIILARLFLVYVIGLPIGDNGWNV